MTKPQEENGATNGDGHSYANNGFSTRALHVGQEASQWTSRAVVPPIVMSTTFAQFAPAVHAVCVDSLLKVLDSVANELIYLFTGLRIWTKWKSNQRFA